jgi:zinc protease
MNRWLWLGVLCLALPMIAHADSDPPALRGVRMETLKNGMRLLMAPDSLASRVDVAIWYDASPRIERTGQTGISHLFEHLMFDGTTRVGAGEYRRRIEAEGGTCGAFTSSDALCLYQTIPASSLDLVFDLEADRMTKLDLTQAKLDREKQRARDEMRERAANPLGRGLQRLYEASFDVLPYRRSILGLESDLTQITLANCRDYYKARFAPNTALLTIVGRFDPEQALALARKRFESLPRSTAPASTRLRAETPRTEPKRVRERNDLQVPILFLGWRGPGEGDDDSASLELLSLILASGASSRLNDELVDSQGTALFVRGGNEPQRDAGLFYVAVGLKPQSDSAAVETAVVDAARKLATQPVTEDELAQARRMSELGLLLPAQTSRGRAQLLGGAEMFQGDPASVSRRLARLRALQPDDLKKAAARFLDPKSRVVVWMPPGEGSAR